MNTRPVYGSFEFSPEARQTLTELADSFGGISDAEVVRRALGTLKLIVEETRNESEILIRRKGTNTLKQLVLAF